MYINLFTSSTLHLCSHSIYPIAFFPEQNEYRIALLFTHKNGDIGANPEGTLRNYDGDGDGNGNVKKK